MKPRITPENNISEAIAELERDKIRQKEELTESYHQKIESLKPVNLIKSAAGNVMAAPSLKKGLLITAAGIAAVFVIKKVLKKRRGGKGLLFMALSGAATMLVKKMMAKGVSKIIK